MRFQSPSNSRRLGKCIITFLVLVMQALLWATLCKGEGGSESPDAIARPVTINFDTLQTNIVLAANQYQIASFSSYSGGTIYTQNDCQLLGSCPNGIVATSGSGYSYWPTADVYVNFAMPVNGLTFRVLGSQAGGSSGQIDVYVNNSYYTTTGFYSGQGYPGQLLPPLTVNLGGIQHVTGIAIRYVQNYDYWFYSNYLLYYDDFTFTPEMTANITNPRASGGLDQTVQSALIGADVSLSASPSPTGGSYSWTFTGSPTFVSGSGSEQTVKRRWTQTGTFRATLIYTKNGVSVTSFVDINVVIPTLTSFSANEVSDQVKRDQNCSNQALGVTYTLGCYHGGPPEDGIIWTATSRIDAVTYLSDPAQSGIKFVQATSVYRKRLRNGNMLCFTARSSQANVASGWQLDTDDPYNHPEHPTRYFSEGNTLIMTDFDAPGTRVEGTDGSGVFFSDDAVFVSDTFETYVFYFTGDKGNPTFQQPLGFQGSSFPYARVAWSWGGQVLFNYFSVPQSLLFTLSTNTNPGPINGDGRNSIMSLATNVNTLSYITCSGTTPTSNPIDGSRFYTNQLYLDFLNRSADQSGWNFWRSTITQCAFDTTCIANKRVDLARAFFYSGEFIGMHPELGGQRGTHDYNSSFVLWCYRAFLRREPNDPPDNNWNGYNFWVGVLDSTNPDAGDDKYNQMLRAFIVSTEYRNRF